jgi:hypothetical protein
LSRKSHLIGGLLCLVGGYLIGYTSGAQVWLKSELGALNSVVNALPFIPGLVNQISNTDWYLASGSVLIIIGILLVLIGGDARPKEPKQAKDETPAPPPRPPGSCKFCGADLKGSKTYCPVCGRSQT